MNQLDLQIAELAREMLMTSFMLAGPILLVGLIVGVGVSLFQALTSLQEQTLSLIPKMLAVMIAALMLLAPALVILRDYTLRVFEQLQQFGLS